MQRSETLPWARDVSSEVSYYSVTESASRVFTSLKESLVKLTAASWLSPNRSHVTSCCANSLLDSIAIFPCWHVNVMRIVLGNENGKIQRPQKRLPDSSPLRSLSIISADQRDSASPSERQELYFKSYLDSKCHCTVPTLMKKYI